MMSHKKVNLDYVKSNYEFENLEKIIKELLKNAPELCLVESKTNESSRINLVHNGKLLSPISKSVLIK